VFLGVLSKIEMGVEKVGSAKRKENKGPEISGCTLSPVLVVVSWTVSRIECVSLVHGCCRYRNGRFLRGGAVEMCRMREASLLVVDGSGIWTGL
jgi:hypothetical protein